MPNPNKKIARALPLARQLALRTLLSMQARDEKIQAALNATLAAAPASTGREDKALCTSLVYGCIRLKVRLDWILDRNFSKPKDVPEAMRRVMRMAVYELFYLSHIPSYATLSSYVEAIKAGYGKSLGGLANAVLRKIAGMPAHDRTWFEREIPEECEFMRVWYSLPAWILEHFLKNYPCAEASFYLEAGLNPPPLGLRANPLAQDYDAVCTALCKAPGLLEKKGNAFAFATGEGPELGEFLGKGLVTRQSYAAQTAMCAIFSGLGEKLSKALSLGPIWDVCAGQGGKTCWLIEQGLPVSLASDTSLPRLKHLKQELHRLALPAPAIIQADAVTPLPVKETPGVILIDAPCSGLGTLARRPDIKIYRHPADLPALAGLQARILKAQFAALPPGGLLVYLTCTLNPAENSEVIDKFTEKNSSAKIIFQWENPAASLAQEFFWATVLEKEK